MAKGYIYIMTNQALGNDIVKIGYAKNVENRRKQLSTTALPFEYEVYATYETSGNLEDKKLHKLIDNLNPDLRVAKNREFFIMTPEDAYELLEAIAIISGSKDKLKKKLPIKMIPLIKPESPRSTFINAIFRTELSLFLSTIRQLCARLKATARYCIMMS